MNILDWLMGFVTKAVENRVFLAVVIGLVFALAVTQWLKFVLVKTKWLPDPEVWILKATALPLGAVPTIMVLPTDIELVVRILLGVVVGASAPYVYKVTTAILYRVWPQLEQRLSVNPYQDGDK